MDIQIYKQTLKERNWTYEDLSEATGLSLGCIKRLMSGISAHPRIQTIEAIEKALGINLLYSSSEEKSAGWYDTKKMNVTPDEEDVLIAYRKVKQKYGNALNKSILLYLNTLCEK